MRRVVVTGLGIVSPLGVGVDHVWGRLTAGDSGIVAIDKFDTSDLPSKIAGQLPPGPKSEGNWTADEWVEPKDQRKMDPFITYGIAAADQAIEDSGWEPDSDEDRWSAAAIP